MKISLKQKKLKSGLKSLYIEYYKGSFINNEGKKKHNREFEYLKLYINEESKDPKIKAKNKETLELANKILSIRQSEYYQGKYNIKSNSKGKIGFLEYFSQKKEERFNSKGNYDNWDAAEKHLRKYCSTSITLNDVDIDFVKGFKEYLLTKATKSSGAFLSQNTKHTYYNKFKACINTAFEDGLIKSNPIKNVKSIKAGETKREYLTQNELQKLSSTECSIPILKRAFIFSCLSGIRWSDINKLVWSEVREEGKDNEGNEIYRIVFRQKKTKGVEYLYISKQARGLLGNRRDDLDRVFYGLRYSAYMNLQLLKWCMMAGITKHITFHSARHTNAVLLLENGADIYTVSKRLGHSEIRTTEIYAKIIDKKMKEAANMIPKLTIKL